AGSSRARSGARTTAAPPVESRRLHAPSTRRFDVSTSFSSPWETPRSIDATTALAAGWIAGSPGTGFLDQPDVPAPFFPHADQRVGADRLEARERYPRQAVAREGFQRPC